MRIGGILEKFELNYMKQSIWVMQIFMNAALATLLM